MARVIHGRPPNLWTHDGVNACQAQSAAESLEVESLHAVLAEWRMRKLVKWR